MNKKSKNTTILIIIAIITILIWQIPDGYLFLYPFTILGTWFHEMGHGVTAMLLGSEFWYLEIYSNGSGLAVHTDNNFFGDFGSALIAMGGPLGPTFVGSTFIALSNKEKASNALLIVLSAVLLLSVLLWIRSFFGILIITAFGLVILFIALKAKNNTKTFTIQFLGVQACVSVYLSINYLFSEGAVVNGQRHLSDTAVMQQNLFLPYYIWGAIIVILSVFLIYKSLRYANK